MAWLDDRIWCHPKLTDVSDRGFRAYVNSIAYSSGMGTKGRLTAGQQKTIGASARERRELVEAGLWDLNGDGQTIGIHDWNEHNGLRDERRARERLRKREARASGRWNEADRTADGALDGVRPNTRPGAAPARVDGSEGSETKDGRTRTSNVGVTSTSPSYEASYERAREIERDDDGEPLKITPMTTLGGQP